MSNIGWEQSADAWIASVGEAGDWGRRYVLDAPMLQHSLECAPATALDVGCGEGRFCRMLTEKGVAVTGIDPTPALISRARQLHADGRYLEGRAEDLGQFSDGAFDLVVSYLSLIDIEAAAAAIAEMARVVRPGGAILVANLNGFATAGEPHPWRATLPFAERRATFDRYLQIRAQHVSWRGITVINWHRPLSWYFNQFLACGLVLEAFLEPEAIGAGGAKADRYRRAPHFCIFRWRKPLSSAPSLAI